MKRVIVTGAGGFVGAPTLPALVARGFEVHALGRTALQVPGVAFHRVDLLDGKSLAPLLKVLRASHLLHLAWYTEPGRYWRSPANLDWTGASLVLIRLFREAGGVRAVVAGTCAEYKWGPPRLREDAPCEPATLYGAAKDATRRLSTAYATESGLSLGWGRLFFLYGPGERSGRLVGDAVRALSAGKRFAASSGRQRRDFSHVEDAADAFSAILDSDATGPINIGSGSAASVWEILDQLGSHVDRRGLIDFGVRDLAPDEPACIEADVTRLREEIGFSPRYCLEEGLRQTSRAGMRSSAPSVRPSRTPSSTM